MPVKPVVRGVVAARRSPLLLDGDRRERRAVDRPRRGAAQAGDWGIFCFHGIGGDHIAIDLDAFEGLARHLAGNRDRIWTDTVLAVADHVAAA